MLRAATNKEYAERGYLFEPPESQRQIGEVPVADNVNDEIFIYSAGASKMAASLKKCLVLRIGSENSRPDAKFLQKRTTAIILEFLKNHVARFEYQNRLIFEFFCGFLWSVLLG